MICILHVKNDDVVGWMIGDDLNQLARRAEFSGFSDLSRALRSLDATPKTKTVLVERTEIGGKFIMLMDGTGL